MNIEKAIVNSMTSKLFGKDFSQPVVTAALLLTLVLIFLSQCRRADNITGDS